MVRTVPASRLLIAFVCVTSLVACGGDDGLSAEEQEFADAFADSLQDDENGLSASAEEAECMGEAIMAELGTDPFDEEKVSADDITRADDANSPGELLGEGVIGDDQANAIIDVWEEDCVDLDELLAASARNDLDLDDEGEACIADGLAEDALGKEALAASFTSGDDTPDEETLTALFELVESCSGG